MRALPCSLSHILCTLLLAMLVTGAVALGILAWIGLTVLQVKDASIDSPLAPRISGAIAAVLVLFAAFWDGAAIRRLAAQSGR